ncbi:uncharacterized protein LOC125498798 [Beta vulgaris subsp. vulgaris]|uniref:uncharacterized protein LOC125498798 n=1 Tax=Beta vulgaris subsp. vulgaris TaxID=3555 RepID=UPI002036B1C0|nr:uncharacterized protein LOC125498798 [Beta vulgaris subsp. vulgaris]
MKNGPVLNSVQQESLTRPVSDEEIFNAMFSIPGDKSPGPDGFGTHFFKDTWPIVGEDISAVIKDFFTSDDVILCSRGDYVSVYSLLQGFKHFSEVSGLEVNENKTEMYTSGMKQEVVQRLKNVTGFKMGSFPFKYLSVPICFKRISIKDCMNLVEKTTSRIKNWSSRNLAYQGRLGVWASDRLVSGILQQWGGMYGLLLQKKDNLWIKWVSEVYIQQQNWWNYQPPKGCSWYSKKICNVKDILKEKITEENLKQMNTYSIKQIYMILTGDHVRVQWDKLVWNRLTVPKHRFFMWLIMLDRLQTSARLCKYGISESANCLICDREEENQDHLMLQCKYSKEIWKLIMRWLQINSNYNTTDGMTRWLQKCRASKFKRQVYIATM